MTRHFNRKGDATDIIFFIIILFFLAVSFIVAIYVNTKLGTIISTTVLNESAAAPYILDGLNNINTTVTQRGYVLMFALFIVGQLLTAFLVRVHPVFIFLYIFTLALSIILAVYLANMYTMIIENQQLNALLSDYTMITWIMQNSVKILIAVGALSMIVTFAKLAGAPTYAGGEL